MELKLEDYARRRDHMYYEIMREYADGANTKRDLEIFIRPASGYLEVSHFILQDKETNTFSLLQYSRSLRGTECTVSAVILKDMALNEPPWVIPAKPAFEPWESLLLYPSFILHEYTPKDETEYYRFGMPEPVTIHLSNVWVREKEKVPNYFGKASNNIVKTHDELDQLIIKIANSGENRSVDTIKNQIKSEFRKDKLKNRSFDKEGILLQWKDHKKTSFIWRHKNTDGKITEKTCSHGTLKNRISKLAKIGVIS